MPPVPVCFVVMPFRTKDTSVPAPAPARVNFDVLWEKALRPAIEALGYRPVRADQDLGALIIQEMLERLYFADLVIADLTIPNGNVYYEVGIRHAARNSGCVLISANWSKQLFDVDQMRQIRYPLPDETATDETASAIRAELLKSIPPLASGASPMFQSLDGYPTDVKAERASVMRTVLDELSEFQAASRAVRLEPKASQPAKALALRAKYGSTPPVMPAVALEIMYVLRDCADWKDVLTYVAGMPAALSKLPAVVEQRCLAQSKSGDHRIAIAALEELVEKNGPTSERLGLIGGRYKKLTGETAEPGEKARLLGRAIASYERGMQLDLNDYYPSCNLPRLYRQRARPGDDCRAQTAATVAMAGCARAKRLNPSDEWVRPTLIGMAFDAGDLAQAEALADEIKEEGAVRWKLDTTIKDLEVSTSLQKNPDVRKGLELLLVDLKALL